MLVSKVTFYKTPLDSTYSNVIDFNADDIKNYFNGTVRDVTFKKYIKENIFDVYYNPLEISLDAFKGVKNNVSQITFTVNKSFAEIREYNYCIITSEISFYNKFYFIEDIISQNDTFGNASCSVVLSTDVWMNNIGEITFNDYTGRTNLRHYDRISQIKDDKLIYNFYNVLNDKIDYNIERASIKDRYKILYCIYELKEPSIPKEGLKDIQFLGKYNNESKSFVIENIYNFIQQYYMKNLLYFPIGLYDTLNDEFVDYRFEDTSFNLIELNVELGGYSLYKGKELYLPIINSLLPYTARIILSYNSPYNYVISGSDDNLTVKFNGISAYATGLNYTAFNCLIIPEQLSLEGEPIITLSTNDKENLINTTLPLLYNKYGRTENINIYETLDIPNTHQLFKNNEIEPQEHCYPLKFISLSVNEYQYPLVSPKIDNKEFILNYDYRTSQCRLVVTDDTGKNVFSPQGFYLKGNGCLSFAVDALQDYLIRNGSQEKTALGVTKMSSGISSLSSLFTGALSVVTGSAIQSPMAVTGGISQIANAPIQLLNPIYKKLEINAKHNDLSNTPDTYNSSTGEGDKTFQDRPQLYVYKANKNDPNYVNIINNYKYYGYNIQRTEKISDINNRIYYDYIKCDFVDLPFNIQNYDKILLKNIFTNGTFKNHFNYNNGNIIFNSSFDKNVSNIERKFYFDETFKNWYDKED